MPNPLTTNRLRRTLKKVSSPQTGWLDVFPAVIGRANGTVLTGTDGIIYVRNFLNGQVLTVYNYTVPNTAGLQVEVGRKVETPGLWQVKGVREAYAKPPGGTVGNSSHSHDDLFIGRDRFMPFLVLPIDGGEFEVQIYGDVITKADETFGAILNQTFDLSPYVPTTGAKYVVIEADDDGVIYANEGSVVDSKELLTLGDIPAVTSGRKASCAVRLYDSQAQLYRDPSTINDFVDLRPFTSGGGGGTDVGTAINDATEDTPLDADEFGFYDVVDALLKKITWANIKATLQSAFNWREVLTANRTYYVRTDGSDSNDGLTDSTGGAFLTKQHAYDVIQQTLDTSGYTVTIKVGDGTYTGGMNFDTAWVGGGQIIVEGNTSTPTNVYVNVTSVPGFLISINLPNMLTIKGFKINTTSYACIAHEGGGLLSYETIYFETATLTHVYVIGTNARVITGIVTNTAIGDAPHHIAVYDNANYSASGTAFAASGTRTFTSTVFCDSGAIASFAVCTFTGTWVGKEYEVDHNGYIFTGVRTIGGDADGTTENGGLYNDIELDTTNFDGILSSSDNSIQTAMETIDDHDHAGKITYLTDSNEFLRLNPIRVIAFTATINGTPSGSTLVYNAPSAGSETELAQYDGLGAQTANNLTGIVLTNTTRGEDLVISDVVLGTNTITFTTAVPGTWANGDTITTNAGVGSQFRAAEIKDTSVIPSTATHLKLFIQMIDTAGSVQGWFQEYTTFAASKTWVAGATPAANLTYTSLIEIKLTSRRILYQVRSPAGDTALLVMRIIGYQE